MNINTILATTTTGSISTYLPYIIVIVAVLAVICLMNWFRSRKAEDHYIDTLGVLNKGAKIKTMSGIYAEVQEVKEVGETKIVLLKLYDGTVIEMDARGIYGLDERSQITEISEEKPQEKTTEEVVEELSKEKPKRTRKPKSE